MLICCQLLDRFSQPLDSVFNSLWRMCGKVEAHCVLAIGAIGKEGTAGRKGYAFFAGQWE
jgi:hypothetical protein